MNEELLKIKEMQKEMRNLLKRENALDLTGAYKNTIENYEKISKMTML